MYIQNSQVKYSNMAVVAHLCDVCKRVKTEMIIEGVSSCCLKRRTEFFIEQFGRMERRIEELEAGDQDRTFFIEQFERMQRRIEELETRDQDRERDLKKMPERLQNYEKAINSMASMPDNS